ncbi:Uncharacterized protein BP5553_10203 [Venustampulla echinocandica]|uniref:Ion transport domain-containing protein n=1 Tax=Venustampulla echinocandica TaxID=2656787 RepID=A0A370T9J8_9HELO|nr:Uncharacterized protein BP5553_10203 [Venustampulla echinocandica]RDL30325.1 Uncharacterized protein BP5553_10203 [Venustampulla echinocandica]
MLSSLLRPRKARQRVLEHSPFSSPYPEPDLSSPLIARRDRQVRHATADWTETEADDDDTDDDEEGDPSHVVDDEAEEDEDGEDGNEDGDDESPLLPIFSAAHLDALPVYNLTHAIRLIVLPKTETTLTWDQLRSPQVSQFLVKPMQQQIRTAHFSRATLYALMANCLQFEKESHANPGNAGNSRTRAMVCELLAIKLLKEYNTRELIDALSYDFFPLQGLGLENVAMPGSAQQQKYNRPMPAAARISTVEVAIRASAKHFLAHPVVVQQLEAIWAGTIVFHSAADNLHRATQSAVPIRSTRQFQKADTRNGLLVPGRHANYGAMSSQTVQLPQDRQTTVQQAQSRRMVTLYDPRDASLFKLSRLRVPRYRQFFSTCSLAILLGLFIAVLSERSSDITTLEVIFWFWSAGFMLDEIVGFNEQGFSLYIMSFWNTFDLGILLLLVLYYSMRLYGLFLVDIGRHEWNGMAYDVLAANAILLFPRLFSVLDHYRYFSQLLIAFRLMAIDLVAVFTLVLIACSGFFVAFSAGQTKYDASDIAYKIFQLLMGFTPAAWEAWPNYNLLGKAILVLFLFICHFLVVTILITVLTNSFMAIVSNANEEHQFVFAVNTISMVKNDALFSYVAPSNIFAWLLTPLRFFMPFRAFIKLNRTVIKVTHLPLLFGIFAYEKLFLARSVFEPTDLVENMGRGRQRAVSFRDTKSALFSPNIRIRQGSVAGFQTDRALDDVFRLAPRPGTIRSSIGRRETHNVISNWMEHQGSLASPPQEQDRSVVDRLEKRRQARRDTMLRHRGVSGTRSVASDPAEFMASGAFNGRFGSGRLEVHNEIAGHTDADGDDELVTNEDDEGVTLDKSHSIVADSDKENGDNDDDDDESYFQTPTGAGKLSSTASSKKHRFPSATNSPLKSSPLRAKAHRRNLSTNTILYNPVHDDISSSASRPKSRPLTAKRHSNANTGANTPSTNLMMGHRTPRHSIYTTANTKPRPILPTRQTFQSVPNFQPSPQLPSKRPRQVRHHQSSLDMGMSDLAFDQNALGAVPSSFATQMAMAMGGLKGIGGGGMGAGRGEDTEGMMGRLMLARMKTLEEGFAEVVKEFRGMRTAGNSEVEGVGGGRDYFGNAGDGRRAKGKGKDKAGRKKRAGHDGRGGIVRATSETNLEKSKKGKQKARDELDAMSPEQHDDPSVGFALERYNTRGSSL